MKRLAYGLCGVLVAAAVFAVALAPSAGGKGTSAPVNKSLPKIIGTAQENQELFADPGKWSGTPPITFNGIWLRCDPQGATCVEIKGSNDEEKYKVVAADVGKTIRVRVTATNDDGKATASSKQTAVVTEAAKLAVNTSPPTITGKAQVGQTLTGDRGKWTSSSPVDYSQFWMRCDINGGACADIGGATATTYKVVKADEGHALRFRVRATNAAGAANALSTPTDDVQGDLPEGAIKLPDGKISIPASSVPPEERLNIQGLDFSPNPLTNRNDEITARFRIFDTRNYVVRDVLVYVIPLPYNWTTQPAEVKNGEDGWATVKMRATDKLPKNSAIVMFVRARRAGDNVLTGISNRRLVQLVVKIP
jgi:hypothetical protein